MPVITYAGTELNDEAKQELIEKLTAIASEVTKTPEQFFTVLVQDYPETSIGIGGETVKEIKSRYMAKN
ncbi:4-oxalocrotonate tautomerase DmpI [Maridesulfovibrio zosterae]|uniref:4-oxalocrotonate tautomerase DmpI n=1 Tax=Maridesulfovibrio zosterae TaxID=82171 RepID=UPI000407041F|nr:4-oxalocrotonate tautomerase DmpI [Maridesulfovibrio zosterae]